MPLGVEYSSTAPQLIQSSGAALVQGIRQIGQQVSGHLTEMQTKRDLAALGQEAQALNVESNEFPTQLAQLVTRHPLAARDERGLMALSAMGKAHGQWQATEAEARAFNRAMAMQGYRQRAAFTQAEAEEEWRRNRPVPIAGVGLVQPNDIDEVTGQPRVLVKAAGPGEFRSSSQGTYSTKTGLGPDGKPLPARPLSTRSANKRLLQTQDQSLRIEISSAQRRKDNLEKQITEDINPVQRQAITKRIFEIDEEVNALRTRRDKIQEAQEALDMQSDEDEAGLLPPLPATTELPILSPAEAAKQPPGTQFRDKNGNVRTVPAPTAG